MALAGEVGQRTRKERIGREARVGSDERQRKEPSKGKGKREVLDKMIYGKSCYLPSISATTAGGTRLRELSCPIQVGDDTE